MFLMFDCVPSFALSVSAQAVQECESYFDSNRIYGSKRSRNCAEPGRVGWKWTSLSRKCT